MITFSPNVLLALESPENMGFFLIKIINQNSTLMLATTSFTQNITMSDATTYLADNRLIGVDNPQFSTTIDREQYRIVLADPDFSLAPTVESNFIGKLMEVRIGFLNPATRLPFTSLNDTIVVYKGKVDSASYQIETEDNEMKLTLSGASGLMTLDRQQSLIFARDTIRERTPDDSCADFVYQGSASIVLKWGRQ